MKTQHRTVFGALGLSLLFLIAPAAQVAAADIVLVNLDPPGAGLNDPTPADPVGGNPGATVGDQRINVYLLAAELWGAELESDVPIFVGATFQPLFCSPTSATLGAAGATYVIWDFPGAIDPITLYHSALADALSGVEQVPGDIDIISFFNSAIDDDPTCLGGGGWYYGFDNNEGPGQADFLAVVMHEIAHGLGFSNFANEATGELFLGRPDIYTLYSLDLTTGMTWDMMTDAERQASAVNGPNVVWNGPSVTGMAPMVLGARPSLQVLRPKALQGSYEVQPAAFGPPLMGGGGTTGQVVLADDGVDVGSDACESIVNNVNGKIALVDRGACTFASKVANAQAAGAKGVIIANNQPAGRPPMAGTDPSIDIPSVGITRDEGDAIKAALKPGVNVKLVLDDDFLAGTTDGYVRLYAPPVVALGSSISHWDTTATPNLLMEPFINSDLMPSMDLDLTSYLFEDIGWVLSP
jgi:hypothetical protein